MKRLILLLSIMVVTLGVAVSSVVFSESDTTGSEGAQAMYINIRTPQVKQLIADASKEKSSSDLVILDVRQPSEYESGHIEGAVFIPLGELQDRLDELDSNKRIIVICRSGSRSTMGSQILISAGFKKVYNYVGGMLSWDGPIETGFPTNN